MNERERRPFPVDLTCGGCGERVEALKQAGIAIDSLGYLYVKYVCRCKPGVFSIRIDTRRVAEEAAHADAAAEYSALALTATIIGQEDEYSNRLRKFNPERKRAI